MRLTDRALHSLVLLNTAALVLIALAGLGVAVLKRDALKERFDTFFERERASSKFITAIDADQQSKLAEYPVYELAISPAILRRIQTQVQQLVADRFMTDDDKNWYPARFAHGDEVYDVKVRLRGDLYPHWSGAKKSWRVQFKNDHLFQGRRALDFIIPGDKSYEVEPVAYQAARELGLLVPDAGFCHLRLNGVDFGAYFWIEKYGPEMLEKLQYPVGEIFRERNVWIQTHYSAFGIAPTYFPSCFDAVVRDPLAVGYSTQRWNQLVTLLRTADDETFRREIPHVLDLRKYLRWNALTWVFGSTHSHWGDNLRWYYDPTRGLFEPILYDVSRYPIRLTDPDLDGPAQWKFETQEHDQLARRILSIPAYRQERNAVLWQLATDENFDLARRCDKYYQQLRPSLLTGVDAPTATELDAYHADTLRILTANRQDLREHLAFARLFVTPVLAADQSAATLRLRLLPDSRNQIRIEQLDLVFSEPPSSAAVRARLMDANGMPRPLAAPMVERPEENIVRLTFDDLYIDTPVGPDLSQQAAEWTLELEFTKLSAERLRTPGFLLDIQPHARNTVSLQPLTDMYTFVLPVACDDTSFEPSPVTWPIERFITDSGLPWRQDGETLVLPADEYTVDHDLTVPAGCGVRLEAGITLRMKPHVSIVCYGPLDVRGTADAPVRIEPQRRGAPWGSFAVIRAGQPSHVQHLYVTGGSETHLNGLYLSGELCFYSSDVHLDQCVIANAHADDGLNVKKATATIENCLFTKNSADAFDGDWVHGTVRACVFIDNGGDGVDISGSHLLVRDCLLSGMGDKGISVGEKSDVFAFNDVIHGCAIGIASKDLSTVDARATVFHENQTAVSLYRKKQLFGGGHGQASGCLFWGNPQVISVDGESSFELHACGVDNWQPSDGVVANEMLPGDPSRFYTCDERGDVQSMATQPSGTPFEINVMTGTPTFEGFTVPELRGKPAGLWQPLNLEAAWSAGARGGDADRD